MGVAFVVLAGLAGILFVLYVVSKWNFSYWKKRNVPHLKPTPLFGNYKEYITLKKPLFKIPQDIFQKFLDEPYVGTYYGTEPALLVQDPEIIKLITTKDFIYFNGREIAKYNDREILTRNMFFTHGDNWKVIRLNTSPLFTTSKMKKMFPLVQNCVSTFEDMLDYETSISDVFEARSLMARFMMDCVCSCVFGVDTNVMGKDVEHNSFRKIGEIIFENTYSRMIATYSRAIWPGIFYRLGFTLFPDAIPNFFRSLVLDVFKERSFKPSSRNDFVDLLLNLKQNEYLTCESISSSKRGEEVRVKVDDDLLVAQCVLYFAAGFETSATASSFTLFHLARDQGVQKRAHEEIEKYLQQRGGKIEYDCVTELPYVEACIDEALRLYPALGLLTREVMEPYVLPDGLKLERGLRIHLPVYYLHRNPQNFPEPERYDPERFLPENKANIKPYTYMPFGEGPRTCVGMRVAKMQMIPGLITVLRKYRVELAEGMPRELTLEARTMVTQSAEDLRLRFIPRAETTK